MIVRHDLRAFHLPATIEPEPGLFEEVTRLQRDDRPGAALAAALSVLRRDPRSADAFRCALMLCSGRTSRSGGEREPIAREQLHDPLLAPIMTVCTRCGDGWFSTHELVTHEYASITALNPIGLQCQRCRYTLCRECLSGTRRCPQNGCAGELGTPVLATGPPVVCLEYAVVLGEHGLPEVGDLLGILAEAAPGVDLEGIGILPVPPPPTGADDEFGLFMVMRLEDEGRVGAEALQRTRMVGVDRPGLGHVRVYLVEAPAEKPRRRRWWRRR